MIKYMASREVQNFNMNATAANANNAEKNARYVFLFVQYPLN